MAIVAAPFDARLTSAGHREEEGWVVAFHSLLDPDFNRRIYHRRRHRLVTPRVVVVWHLRLHGPRSCSLAVLILGAPFRAISHHRSSRGVLATGLWRGHDWLT